MLFAAAGLVEAASPMAGVPTAVYDPHQHNSSMTLLPPLSFSALLPVKTPSLRLGSTPYIIQTGGASSPPPPHVSWERDCVFLFYTCVCACCWILIDSLSTPCALSFPLTCQPASTLLPLCSLAVSVHQRGTIKSPLQSSLHATNHRFFSIQKSPFRGRKRGASLQQKRTNAERQSLSSISN